MILIKLDLTVFRNVEFIIEVVVFYFGEVDI